MNMLWSLVHIVSIVGFSWYLVSVVGNNAKQDRQITSLKFLLDGEQRNVVYSEERVVHYQEKYWKLLALMREQEAKNEAPKFPDLLNPEYIGRRQNRRDLPKPVYSEVIKHNHADFIAACYNSKPEDVETMLKAVMLEVSEDHTMNQIQDTQVGKATEPTFSTFFKQIVDERVEAKESYALTGLKYLAASSECFTKQAFADSGVVDKPDEVLIEVESPFKEADQNFVLDNFDQLEAQPVTTGE